MRNSTCIWITLLNVFLFNGCAACPKENYDFAYQQEFEAEFEPEQHQEQQKLKEIKYSYSNIKPPATVGLLYPRESETREVRSLDGMWLLLRSNASDPLQGIREKWYNQSLRATNHSTILMPVPASYNDVTVDQQLRDHVGTVWYERQFFVPTRWRTDKLRTWLRFGSVHYQAVVWINGQAALRHNFGHLPFEAEIDSFVKYGSENRITIMVDNRLNNRTIPQGKVLKQANDDGVVYVQTYTFDFFNYAGIHRSVHLYTTPQTHISDVELRTLISINKIGRIDYRLWFGNEGSLARNSNYVLVQLRDETGTVVAHQINRELRNGTLLVTNVKPWWPYLMDPVPGYMYSLEFLLFSTDESDAEANSQLIDAYRMPIGIRSLSWNNDGLYLNGKSLYLRGFGKHEDSDIRGKGLDNAMIMRDFNLLKWIGANAYRTSHYPYSEESMQFADKHGIMIIDECPSVNTDLFEPQLLLNHMSALEQLIHRDRNHASVIAWSIANEPRTQKMTAEAYFGALTNYTRGIAHGRPLTAASNVDSPSKCKMSQFLDIIGFNRYNAWYHNAGRTDMIVSPMYEEAKYWRERYQKPIIVFEYGGDTLEGYHTLPAFIWSEEYQTTLFSKHFQAFDKLRQLKWFMGEFVWNFADFKTEQTITRVGGNKKGVFTRDRQPKAVAHLLRQRYYALALKLDNASMPVDLFNYIIEWN
ncbi:beta-glucuronidase [Drosophila grimshawi]|uniref:GH22628 n=1 Tax=Drosophila grimshawi TaxID=7222 RepID=B4JVP6_DROGR|nr:beta-glucuronidase [Drosophila grimshawi]EDV98514.1 GH22628 [Drosophila grimshawi]